MKLSTYNNLQEKSDIFKERYQRIDTWSALGELLKQGISDSVFRGMYEAKYKNYTSAQRYFITNELGKSGVTVSQVVQNEVSALFSENNLLSMYFDSLGVEKNWFLLNSFLQHYGGVTPLLDFTKNPLVALYFMQEKATVPTMGGDDIDNYCSLYYIKIGDMDTVNSMIEEIVKRFSAGYEKIDQRTESADKEKYPQVYKMTKEAIASYKQHTKSYIHTFFSEKFFAGYEELQRYMEDEELLLFVDNTNLTLESAQLNINKRVVMTPNLNSIAQEGVFVMRAGMEPVEKEHIHCIDIHKSLITTIREYLKQKDISKEAIFPQEEKIAAKALGQSLLFDTINV